jgi:hypothetical protein
MYADIIRNYSYDVPMDYTVELSTSGYTFFENLFYKFAEVCSYIVSVWGNPCVLIIIILGRRSCIE